jgi:hypothetical protein
LGYRIGKAHHGFDGKKEHTRSDPLSARQGKADAVTLFSQRTEDCFLELSYRSIVQKNIIGVPRCYP